MQITKETFKNLSNKTFEITFDKDNVFQSELIEVTGNTNIPLQEGQSEPFSLVFEVEGDKVFDQNTYIVSNTEFEAMPLFLVPISAGEKSVKYEAIFN